MTDFISPHQPAIVLAPMDGVTDFAMRELLSRFQPYSYTVSEFVRVNEQPPPSKVFLREIPELETGARTASGVPVQVQLLGGNPEVMAYAAHTAVRSGARAIDINFGCPAPTVNRHDGGATLLRFPDRIERIVQAVRDAVPRPIPVSAKLRLGWDSITDIYVNAERAARGGADWITIHGRTKFQGYTPPAYWEPIGAVRRQIGIPVVANGEIWTVDDLRRCRDITGCDHFMIGRGALARPWVVAEMATEIGLTPKRFLGRQPWLWYMIELRNRIQESGLTTDSAFLSRAKQWLRLASRHGDFPIFDLVKRSTSARELLQCIEAATELRGGRFTLTDQFVTP